jgi:TonB family protein
MDNLIYSIENFARSWLEFILSSSLQLGIFLVLIAAITFIFRKQSAKFLYILWLIGLFKVLIPPNITIPDFFASVNIPIETNIFILPIPDLSFIATTVKTPELSYRGYLLLFWIIGILFISVVWIFNNIRFYQGMKQDSFRLDKPELDRLVKYKNSRIKFISGPNITIPFTRGIFRPKIFLPNQAMTWSRNELRAVVLHEYAHIKRKDILVIAFQNIIQILFFFHPLVWLANIQITRYREKACDDFAINAMNANSVEYSKLLLKSIDKALNRQPLPSLSNYFCLSKKSLLNRFEYILNRKEFIMNKFSRFQKFVLFVLVIIGVAISCHKEKIKGRANTSAERKFTSLKYSKDLFRAALVDSQIIDFDVPPTPKNGFDQYEEFLKYPNFLKKRGPYYNLKINENGEVIQKDIKSDPKFKNISKSELMAQMIAGAVSGNKIGTIEWKPAQKDNKSITTWITVPIVFINESAEKTLDRFKSLDPKIKLSDYWTKSIENAYTLNNEIPIPPPPPSDSDDVQFIPYDKPPHPIGGFAAIQENLHYPEIARRAGIEGAVIVYAKIDTEGVVTNTKIVKPLGENNGCNEAAVEALKSVKWMPAKQRDKSVAVWASVPVMFKLSQETKQELSVPGSDIHPEPMMKNNLQQERLQRLPYDTPPSPVGGVEAIYENLSIPEIVKKIKLEGKVEIYTKIDENGKIIETRTKKSLCTDCEKAAISALKSVKWIPAKLNDKPVVVWVNVPLYLTADGDWKRLKQTDRSEGLRKMFAEHIKQVPPPPPPIQNFDDLPFVPYDEHPKPVEGFEAIYRNLVYPNEAKEISLEGIVIVYTQVKADGTVGATNIFKSIGYGCDEAAVKAIKSVKWIPAKQKDKPVNVWVSVPVRFNLE